MKDEEILKRILEIFKQETQEHLDSMYSGLLELEKADPDKKKSLLEKLFREAHSLKGAARAANQPRIEALGRSIEEIFAEWRLGKITQNLHLFDLLHRAMDTIGALTKNNSDPENVNRSFEIINQLSGAPNTAMEKSTQEVKSPIGEQTSIRSVENYSLKTSSQIHDPLSGTMRIGVEQLETLLREAEEMMLAKMTLNQQLIRIESLSDEIYKWKLEANTVDSNFIERINHADSKNQINNIFNEFTDWNFTRINRINDRVVSVVNTFRQILFTFNTTSQRHLQNTKHAFLLPFTTLTEVYAKLVRDLSREQGKKIEIVVVGNEIEIDRRILQELKTPLLHLIRNAVDHGIETSEERIQKGKVPKGSITIKLERIDSSKFQITFQDDGRGIDINNVKTSAIDKKIITPERASELSNNELLDLIFISGISTRHNVSDISGWGLGLAIVREYIEKLSGQVWVQTELNKGTVFRIILPTTIATLHGVRVAIADREYIIPTAFIEKVLRISNDSIRRIENHETVDVGSETISLVRLQDLLNLQSVRTSNKHSQIVVLQFTNKKAAFSVDHIIDEQEYIVKPLGPQLESVRMFAGATMIGTGQVVPILNITDLLISERVIRTKYPTHLKKKEISRTEGKTILVVEDSITSRTLIKNILESSGYTVISAIDGAEGLAIIKTERINLVVSDIDMPRMDGIEMTRRIRADKRISELPIILITALETRENKEQGIDAGANAYIVKSAFENQNLLDTIKRLL